MKKIISAIIFLVILFLCGLLYSDITSPYGKFSTVKSFFSTTIDKNGQIILTQIRPIYFTENPFITLLTYPQRFFRTVGNARFSEKPFSGTVDQIISQIHSQRFDVSKPYVISGAHFAEFYVRNFGIFYAPVLDPRFALSQKDWELRQRVTLQTVATHLQLLKESGKEYTTFVPMWNNTFTGINWAADPSDSLFAVYYTVAALTDKNFIITNFPSSQSAQFTLQTQSAGNKLLSQYNTTLSKTTDAYLKQIINPQNGLIKKDILLSSARDGIQRQSSFYDNVIAWATAKLATSLGVTIVCPAIISLNNHCDFDNWKQKIITAFWDEKTGIFLDDLSTESKQNHIFSGDAFIVTSTRFLDFANKNDRTKLEREITYVQNHKLDKPFPLFYAIEDQPNKLYFFVRYFATSYMGKSIWSHWGMEYIKTLSMLSSYNPRYMNAAKEGFNAYTQNIQKFGGYPELYDQMGNIFATPFYKSILHTGWVVNYEQTRMMINANKNI